MGDRSKEPAGIYKITCLKNNKIYIGSSIELHTRRRNHFLELRKGIHYNSYLQRAFDKYGEDSFQYEILEYIDIVGLTQEEAIKRVQIIEQEYLDKYKSYDPDIGFNLDKTASGGKEKFTYQDIVNGKCVYTVEQFDQAINLLSNTKMPLRKIAKITGITYSMIKAFYYKSVFKEYLKDIKFIDRTKQKWIKEILENEDNKKKFIEMVQNGTTIKQMKEEWDLCDETIKKIKKELNLN